MKFNLNDLGFVQQFLKLPEQRLNYVKKMTAIAMYERLSRRAPVLTGRYRWGFNCSVNGIDYTVPPPAPEEYSRNNQVYYNFDAERGVRAFMRVGIVDDVVVANSTPYAAALENGHSRQAPGGIFRVTIPEVKEDLKKYAAMAQAKDGGL